MVKRIFIAIAAVVLAATSAHALGPEPDSSFIGGNASIKVDIERLAIGFPFEYKPLDICVIPVSMNVGFFVQVEDCDSKKIELQQVDCADIGKGSSDWPCYFDCETIRIRSNFEVKLGIKLKKESPVIDQWEAYYDGTDIITPSGDFEKVIVCVRAWKAQLHQQSPGTEVRVGSLTITVKPNV